MIKNPTAPQLPNPLKGFRSGDGYPETAVAVGLRIVAFGGGTDSTAILCEWVHRGLVELQPIDHIIFADTGGERPHTYEHIERMNSYLPAHGLPQITVVKKTRKDQSVMTLEENCLAVGTLPSIAFGFKTCSQKFKVQPQEKAMNRNQKARDLWKSGDKVEKLIGYEFEETRRWMKAPIEDEKYLYRYPLVEWEMRRMDCYASIKKAGLPLPGKSSCFFCPSTTKPEIDELSRTYPILFQRAIAMEDNARPHFQTIKGLGRRFSWRDYATTIEEPQVQSCMFCIDES